MPIAFQQTIAALKNWPERAQWIAALRLAIPALVIIAAIGFLSGWLVWAPAGINAEFLVAAVLLFFLPALLVELVFRGLLLSWLAQMTPRWGAWLSTLLFVAWFPVLALTVAPPWADMFLHPTFWIAALILGIILVHIRMVSRSLWPVIVIDWLAVLMWKALFGAPFY